MKNAIISAIIATIVSAGILARGTATAGTTYPETLYITEIDGDTVYCRTFAGEIDAFDGADDWQVNDIVSAVMDNNGTTDTITDDYFVDIRYSGWIE